MEPAPGQVVLFGSGETAPSGRRVYEWLLKLIVPPVRLAILETPAGFQPNTAVVAGKVADYLRVHLANYRLQVDVVPARRKGSEFSPDDPSLIEPLLRACAIFLGPGSPTYAARQLENSLAWRYLQARHRLGGAVILASAATAAASAYTIPVYEIYKAGLDLHWAQGLDFFAPYGLRLVLVPHWNNCEGGAELDTSRCFMGRERFARLRELLPEPATIVGIDEHTALIVDLAAGRCLVFGRGGVTILRQGEELCFGSGRRLPLDYLGDFHPDPTDDLPAAVWDAARAPQLAAPAVESGPPDAVLRLVAERETARGRRDWPAADRLRQAIADSGWQVADSREGPVVSRLPV